MRLGVPKEVFPGERRVAITPANVEKFKKLGFEVAVQSEAGLAAGFDDAEYTKAGAVIVADAKSLLGSSDVVLKVRAPSTAEIPTLKAGSFLASLIMPAQNPDLLKQLSMAQVSTLALDAIPRTTRAQKMDVLSSMANLAGYRAVVEAAAVIWPVNGRLNAAAASTTAR